MTLHHTVTGSGDPVVLLHAGVADSRMWDPLAPLAHQFTLIAPDLRGFGQSPLPAADEEWSNAHDVLALMDHLDVRDAALVGSSFGGRVAQEVATLAPDRVRRLVLICAASRAVEPTPSVMAFGDEEDKLLEAGDIDAASRLNVDSWIGPDADAQARQLLYEMQRHAFEVQLAAGDVEPAEVEVDLDRLTMPTTVFYGSHDFDLFENIARHLHEHIEGSTLVELSWAGHLPTLERPDEMARLLAGVLA